MAVGQKRLLRLFNGDFSLPVTNFDISMKNVHQLPYVMQKKEIIVRWWTGQIWKETHIVPFAYIIRFHTFTEKQNISLSQGVWKTKVREYVWRCFQTVQCVLLIIEILRVNCYVTFPGVGGVWGCEQSVPIEHQWQTKEAIASEPVSLSSLQKHGLVVLTRFPLRPKQPNQREVLPQRETSECRSRSWVSSTSWDQAAGKAECVTCGARGSGWPLKWSSDYIYGAPSFHEGRATSQILCCQWPL